MRLQVETLVGVYIAVCVSMILFNCFLVLGRRIPTPGKGWRRRVRALVQRQLRAVEEGEAPPQEIQRRLTRCLCLLSGLSAFQEEMGPRLSAGEECAAKYLLQSAPMFSRLAIRYRRKNSLKKAYFAYLMSTYRLAGHSDWPEITKTMLLFVTDPSAYCRQNALMALYRAGDAQNVAQALLLMTAGEVSHDEKLVMDGLMEFGGDREELADCLWESLDRLSEPYRLAVMNFTRMVSDRYQEAFYEILASPDTGLEERLASVRYLWKHQYEPAGELLQDFLLYRRDAAWEVRAVSATALRAYPGEKTTYALKAGLYDLSWYVRNNSADSLKALGVPYQSLADVYNSSDRYAREMLSSHMQDSEGQF